MLNTGLTGKHCLLLLLILLLPCNSLFAGSRADSRLALIIGNSNYDESPLANPLNDAADMASTLEDLGFEVMLRTDADRREMAGAIREFGRRLKDQRGVGLFYYAGHGVQLDRRNYLIPVNAQLQEEDEIPYESIDVGSVLAKMESAGNSLNILILDACRSNPFPQRFRSSNRGLARADAPVGSLVVYATAPGKVAADGDGRNGIFTAHLLRNLKQSGLSLTQIIRQTRAAVVKQTNGSQVPWESSSLLKDFYLTPNEEQSVAAAIEFSTDNATESNADPLDALFWKSAQAGNTDEEYLAYLEQFPAGTFAALARARLKIHRQENTAPVSEPDDGNAGQPENADKTLTALNSTSTSKSITSSDLQEHTSSTDSLSSRGALTVKVSPDNALVRIMNIVEEYRPGILLDRSKEYDVYVTLNGYQPWRDRIKLLTNDHRMEVALQKKPLDLPGMVHITGGQFRMGCSSGDRLCDKYEKPAHDVVVAAFGMSRTEITVGQFRSFIDSTGHVTDAEKNSAGFEGCYVWTENGGISRSNASWKWQKGKSWRNPGYAQNGKYPATCVSWNDASAYAKWLGSVTGKHYRLPTEAEWEYAARAGHASRYDFGDDAKKLCRYANGADKTPSPNGSNWSGRLKCTDEHWFSAPVATFQANALGLHDMQGNVWEWVEDTWSPGYQNTPTDGRAHLTGQAEQRVLRGGAWDGGEKMLRVTNRSKGKAGSRAAMTGFRLVANP